MMLSRIVSTIANVHKAWNNFGVYGHSRLISFIVQIIFNLLVKSLLTVHKILDILPCINNNERKISTELRAIDSLLFIVKSAIPMKHTWPIFNNSIFRLDIVYLRIFNRICNYGMGCCVPIPRYTNITKQTLYKTHFIISCKDKLKERYNISFDLNTAENADYTKFCPRNVDYLWISHDEIEDDERNNNQLIIYIHGGGYCLGGPSHIGYASRLSLSTNTKILFINYAKPPIADIPYQVDQVLTIYFYLLLYYNMDNKRIIIGGDSAGGGLCTLLIQKLSSLNLISIHPLGIILYSPWVDLAMDTNSWIECQYHDLIVHKTYVSRSGLIAVGNKQNNLRSPFFSAIYAQKYKVNCNVMIFVSKHECLYDDSQKLVEKLKKNNYFKKCKGKENKENEDGEMDDFDLGGIDNYNYNDNKKVINDKELIYHAVPYMPHAFVIFNSVFPEADHAMQQVKETINRWLNNNN